MQGAPPRAYLLARAPLRKEMLDIAVGTSTEAVEAALAKAVAELRLVVFEDSFRSVRVLPQTATPRIAVDPVQHACFLERPRDLGCCLGDGPRDRGCLPKADPPSATLRFDDAASGETLTLRYPLSRELQLRRKTTAGETLYWCHGWQHAPLREPGP